MPDPASPKTYRIRRAGSYTPLPGPVNPCRPAKVRSERTFPRSRCGQRGTAVRLARLQPRARRVCPGRSARRDPSRLRAPARAGRARRRGRSRARLGGASRRRGRDGHRQEPRVSAAGARVRAGGWSSRRRPRRSRSSCSPRTCPAAARALGREVSVAVLEGQPELPLPQAARRASGRCCCAIPATRRRWEALQPWLDETETGDRAELPLRAVGGALGRARSRRRPLRRPPLSASSRPASPRPRRVRAGEAELVIANHALYFADLAAGGGVLPEHDAVVFDEAHRLEETAATWLGGRVSRAGLRRLAADVERACRDGGRRRAGPRRSTGSSRPANGSCGRSPRRRAPAPARDPGRDGARPRRRARRARRRSSHGRAEGLDQLARRALADRRPGRGAASSRAGSNGSSGPSPTRSPGRRSMSRRELRERLWDDGPDGDPRLGDADDGRGRDASSAAGSASITPASSSSAPRSTSASRRSSTSRGRCPTRAATASASASPRRSSRCSRSRAGGRSCSPRATGRSTCSAQRLAGRVPYDGARPGRGAARAAARALPRRGRLGAARDLDLLAGRRHPGRVAVAARDRQAARSRRPATRCTRRAARRSRPTAATGFATTRCRSRCFSSARASGG